MLKITKVLLIVFLLMGCSATIHIITPNRQRFQNYNIGELQQSNIGDPIIQIESANVRDAYIALMDYQTPTIGIQGSKQIFINRDDRFTTVANNPSNSDDIYIKREGPEKTYRVINIFKNGITNRGWVFTNGVIPLQGTWLKEQIFEKSNNPSRGKNLFKSEIIYSGLTGNTLRAVYREFADDFARPAFSQELQYNLDESNIIAYKSLRIEIVKATNSSIEYKVGLCSIYRTVS
ncbi:MAG: hypothetical protein KAH33_04980 [Candidatus Delongbacteria bacterium]|nr:hypothetical protein [Candidatus Delongbacteria bacterium]